MTVYVVVNQDYDYVESVQVFSDLDILRRTDRSGAWSAFKCKVDGPESSEKVPVKS